MNENKEVKGGISQAVDILKTERDRIQHIIDLLEGNAEAREVDGDRQEGTNRQAKEQKPRKKPPATMKRSYLPSHKHIRTVLEEAGESLTPFRISRLLLEKFNIKTTESALNKIFKADDGYAFREAEQGKWRPNK